MLRVWRRHAASYEVVEATAFHLSDDVVWMDLVSPTPEEEKAVETALHLDVPTMDEMMEIEASSRLYRENGAIIMTALVLCRHGEADSKTKAEPVSFVLAGERLVTIRYVEPKSFKLWEGQVKKQPELCASGRHVFLGLLGAIVDRLADILEETGAHVRSTANAIFRRSRGASFEPVINRLGAHQNLNVQAHESLVSVGRMAGFAAIAPHFEHSPAALDEIHSQERDVQSLIEHSGYLADSIQFLLDAALGLIGIEQNETNKVFSIVAVLLMPPTLIAGVYGMNFAHMPELKWHYGYPMALVLMAVSVVVGLVWIRRRGWI